MEKSKEPSKRSILLGYFINYSGVNNELKSKSLILTQATKSVEKITDGEVSKRILAWRDLSKPEHQIMILSCIHEKNGFLSVFPMAEEISLVDLGPYNAVEEDGINLKGENIREKIRRSCSALCQQHSVDVIEVDPCDYPQIAAESAVYGIFHRNEIDFNIPKSSYFYNAGSEVSPVSILHLSVENICEPTEESLKAFQRGLIVGECQNFARFLHGAGSYISRAEFIKNVKEKVSNIDSIEFLERDEIWIQSMGMKSILQAANINKKCTDQGKFCSCFQTSPCLLEFHYDSCLDSSPVMLVGRSSFYDSCNSFFMTENKQPAYLMQNLSGGASIIGTILALARLQVPVKVIGIIVVCDHSFCWRKVSDLKFASEYDIFSEVPDSHEERLILKDAVSYACTFKPKLILTLATQTNYLTEAFETHTSVIYSSLDSVADLFLKICSNTGERFIRLPFVDIEDDIFNECVIKKQFCSDCREVLNRPLSPETRRELVEYISKNWDYCFVTSCCLKDLLEDQNWLHLELNRNLLFHKNGENEVYEQYEITGSPTRSLIYFIEHLAK